MLILLAKFTVKTVNIERMLPLAEGMIEPSNSEEGCISYEFYQAPFNPDTFIFVERWRSKEDLDLHFEMPYFKDFDSKVGELVVEKPSVITYEASNENVIV